MAERVRPDMVGAVLSVLVHQDEKVQAGQAPVLLVSMKMEIPAVPEGHGTVTRIAMPAGEVGQAGDVCRPVT
ncbi:MAG: acetyl-CoA carboxylase biotin carboxyl carrier protein subunit [Micrococcales bacterium]|nr:MAG: acetyl-CoA carboxylase biotin carboxyl carrier protein subunit [Micrococcales bacterium]PIE26268.1 MAG: acetyl-CoA carboxylase biotin carboxyl carrier protein subunit [Micrococcales bacterium]